MIPDDVLLMIPGPTNLPPQVREALGRPAFYHRGPHFAALLDECTRGLQQVFQTSNEVLILTSSGTGAVEAAIVNVLSPGDRVLVIESGKFGERMREIAEAFGARVDRLVLEPGRAADPDDVAQRLDGHVALLFVQNETSTGVRQDADALARVAREAGALVVVDTVSSMGGMPILTDEWGLDVVAAGSQKALMLPPGLAFVSVSERAWRAAETSQMPKYYFDLVAARKSLAKGQTPWTPNVSMIRALRASLELIMAEGLENVWRRHHALGEATRAAIRAASLELLADPAHASDVVTAVKSPGGLDSTELVKRVLDRHGVLISGGQGELKGKIFRIGHMGCCQLSDLLRTLQAVGTELNEMGVAVPIADMLDAARAAYGAVAQAEMRT
ncbi:MAG: alanine--glyoxylate aminotransferase family protein [Armatimonadetes bacterium]|nr:alanine--glyoxylate aminotransferase family protein [Armatimonadota bacterium]